LLVFGLAAARAAVIHDGASAGPSGH